MWTQILFRKKKTLSNLVKHEDTLRILPSTWKLQALLVLPVPAMKDYVVQRKNRLTEGCFGVLRANLHVLQSDAASTWCLFDPAQILLQSCHGKQILHTYIMSVLVLLEEVRPLSWEIHKRIITQTYCRILLETFLQFYSYFSTCRNYIFLISL